MQFFVRSSLMFVVAVATSVLVASPTAAGDNKSKWISLFDGQSLDGWKRYRGSGSPGEQWQAQDGVLHLTGRGGGDISTTKKFRNFELELEWKISAGGNSGIMYRVKGGDVSPWRTGPEYQILDNAKHRDGQNPLTSAAALYGMVPADGGMLKPVGKYNKTKIVLKGNHLEHWLNGKKVVEIEIKSERWKKLYQASKFRDYAKFGQMKTGYIVLQDHGNPVWYRNIRIRRLSVK
ncbi:MAG: DUF1080 domain-containing protein [Gemmataceae bacterium]